MFRWCEATDLGRRCGGRIGGEGRCPRPPGGWAGCFVTVWIVCWIEVVVKCTWERYVPTDVHTLLLLLPPALHSTGAVPFGGAGWARPESM